MFLTFWATILKHLWHVLLFSGVSLVSCLSCYYCIIVSHYIFIYQHVRRLHRATSMLERCRWRHQAGPVSVGTPRPPTVTIINGVLCFPMPRYRKLITTAGTRMVLVMGPGVIPQNSAPGGSTVLFRSAERCKIAVLFQLGGIQNSNIRWYICYDQWYIDVIMNFRYLFGIWCVIFFW